MSEFDKSISAHPAYGQDMITAGFHTATVGPEKDPRMENIRALTQTPRQGEFTAQEARSIYIRGYGITSAADAKPVLGTSGMGPCLGVALYNPATKTGAIAHFDTNTDISSLGKLIEDVGGKDQKLEVHLAGGQLGQVHSHRMVGSVIDILGRYDNVTIKSADIMNPAGGLKSLALDTRTGETYSQFMGSQLDKGENHQAIMNHHARTAMEYLPLRPEYVNGQSFSPPAPDELKAKPPELRN